MNRLIHIELQPLGKTIRVRPGTPLRHVLFPYGVEFPCGGKARCRGCRIKIVQGEVPITPEQQQKLSPKELAEGWRLACCVLVTNDLTIDLAQWETPILSDDTPFSFEPAPGLGIAIDLGTTTIVAQLLDRSSGHILGVQSALNAQATHGADIMTRIQYDLIQDNRNALTRAIRNQIALLIPKLFHNVPASIDDLRSIVLVGNTVMHHLFCGLSVESLAHYPFESPANGLQTFRPSDLAWPIPENVLIQFLPCLGGFVGSDILAGILATRIHENSTLQCLIDLGTNGEIVIGNRERMLCASTAAGPAFEGARISMGMRAITGAISEVRLEQNKLVCGILGGGNPRGICGSGLVDAVAVGLDTGVIQPRGRLTNKEEPFLLQNPVKLTQADIRELQLTKGAIAAGLRILLDQWNAQPEQVEKVYLAGAFGNYINLESARRIGLIPFSASQIQSAGNTALLGAKMALFNMGRQIDPTTPLRQRIRHVNLNTDPRFEEIYIQEMQFPPSKT
jgi:uncharacterized 2Fe-2S/4Fe-4S cluster protein (DUF4445 family)